MIGVNKSNLGSFKRYLTKKESETKHCTNKKLTSISVKRLPAIDFRRILTVLVCNFS